MTLSNFMYRILNMELASVFQDCPPSTCVPRNYSKCFWEVCKMPRFGVKSFLVLLPELYCTLRWIKD